MYYYREVADNDALLSELNKEHSSKIETLEEHRTMLQVYIGIDTSLRVAL